MEKFVLIDSSRMQANNSTLFSTAYLAPVEYYRLLTKSDKVLIENAEHYQKQTYRNRCRIAAANGTMDLCIPIEKSKNTPICDVKISNQGNWQTQHWRSIASAYNSSPFFEYYVDDLKPFFEKKWLFLWDFNTELQNKIFELLEFEKQIKLTKEYQVSLDISTLDVRNCIHPKKESFIKLSPYYQVFEQKFGFIPNLSIIDLLFNMGNESQLLLNKDIEFSGIKKYR